jgi:transcriptional regulator with XRE-family HTH domain
METFTLPATRITSGTQFGRLLRTTRLAAGLTVAQVARELGVSPGAVSIRELGQRNITVHDAVNELALVGYDLVVMRTGQIVGIDAVRDPQAR